MQQFNSENFSFSKQIKRTYTDGDRITRLIFLYVAIYLLTFFVYKSTLIGNFYMTATDSILSKPWKFFTYSFFFDGFFDLIFKCFLLRMSASLFGRFFDTSLFLRVYFTGIFLSGVFFYLLTQLPVYAGDFYLILFGNIPGILATVSALSYHTPNHEIKILGGFSIKVLYLMLGFAVIFLLGEPLINVFTYLFSLLVGRGYMMLHYKGTDLAKPIDRLLTSIFTRRRKKS